MKFRLTIKNDGIVFDELETDFVMATVHCEADGKDAYQNLFYADCTKETVGRGLRSAMQNVTEHFTEDVLESVKNDTAEPYDPFGGEVN